MKALKSFEPVPSQGFPIKFHYVVIYISIRNWTCHSLVCHFFFHLSPWGDKVGGSQEIEDDIDDIPQTKQTKAEIYNRPKHI